MHETDGSSALGVVFVLISPRSPHHLEVVCDEKSLLRMTPAGLDAVYTKIDMASIAFNREERLRTSLNTHLRRRRRRSRFVPRCILTSAITSNADVRLGRRKLFPWHFARISLKCYPTSTQEL